MNTKARIDDLRFILRTFLAERKEYLRWLIPDKIEKQRAMMRALLNVRPQGTKVTDFCEHKMPRICRRSRTGKYCRLLHINGRVWFSEETGGKKLRVGYVGRLDRSCILAPLLADAVQMIDTIHLTNELVKESPPEVERNQTMSLPN